MKHHRYLRFMLALCLGLTSSLIWADNSDDSTGKDETQVFHINDGLDIVSTLKFAYGKPKIVVKAVYPQLETDRDMIDGINTFNETVTDLIEKEIEQYKSVVAANESTQKTDTKEDAKNNLYIDYDTSTIKSDHDHILSVRFSMQGYVTGIQHPYHYHRSVNYDLDANQQIELADLFNSDADYLKRLSDYTSAELARRFPNKSLIAQGTTADEDNFKIWNIKPEGILITFENYQVAPNVYGTQTVLVPFSALKDILAPDSLIAGCVNHKKRCLQNNVLTGGFMEVATNSKHQRGKVLVGMNKPTKINARKSPQLVEGYNLAIRLAEQNP